MSRLKRYIVEEEGILSKYLTLIEKECQPYIKAIRGGKGLFARVTSEKSTILKKKVRTDRRPLDTSVKIHKWFDRIFEKKFGWKARSNAIFCYGRPADEVALYDFLVFPIDKFKYVWSPNIFDLYNITASQPDDYIESNDDVLETYKYTDKGLKKALVSGNEIMVNCKEVYLVRGHFLQYIDEKLNLKLQGLRRTKIG